MAEPGRIGVLRFMALQRFFPRRSNEQAIWYGRFGRALHELAPILDLPPVEVTGIIIDALYLEHCLRVQVSQVRSFNKAVTAAMRQLVHGQGTEPVVMPSYKAPALPGAVGGLPAVVPVRPGAHQRIMKFIQIIKARPAYTRALGKQLGVVGAGEAAAVLAPTFTVETLTAPQGQHVRVRFRKHGRKAVVIFSRRGGGDWEMLGVDMKSPFIDKRPPLVAGRPETREYRLQFFEDDRVTGNFSTVATITVGA